MRYLDSDTLHALRDAHAMGANLDDLAHTQGLTEPELRQLLGLPQWKPIQGTLFPQLGSER